MFVPSQPTCVVGDSTHVNKDVIPSALKSADKTTVRIGGQERHSIELRYLDDSLAYLCYSSESARNADYTVLSAVLNPAKDESVDDVEALLSEMSARQVQILAAAQAIQAIQENNVPFDSKTFVDADGDIAIMLLNKDNTGNYTLQWMNSAGAIVPANPPYQTAGQAGKSVLQKTFIAQATNDGFYSINETLIFAEVIDIATSLIDGVYWYNVNLGSVIAAENVNIADLINDELIDLDMKAALLDILERQADGTQKTTIEGPVTVQDVAAPSTYAAAITNLVAANLATDIFEIRNPANSTKVLSVKHLSVTATASRANNYTIQIIKRAGLNTGGSPTTLSAVKMDSVNPNASAQVYAYNNNLPTTPLPSGGLIHTEKVYVGTTAGGNPVNADLWEMDKADNSIQSITLRPNESLTLNLNGVTISGNSFNIDILWTETAL